MIMFMNLCYNTMVSLLVCSAMRQIDQFQIGVLDKPNTGSRLVPFMTWEQLEEAGKT